MDWPGRLVGGVVGLESLRRNRLGRENLRLKLQLAGSAFGRVDILTHTQIDRLIETTAIGIGVEIPDFNHGTHVRDVMVDGNGDVAQGVG